MRLPRLIVTDLDGTFLRADQTISPTNVRAAAAAAERGIPLVVATGRPTRWLDVLDGLPAAHAQVVVSNGAAVIDLASRALLRDFPLDATVALDVAARLRRAISGISFGFETGTDFGCEPESPSRQRNDPRHLSGELPDLIVRLGRVIKMLGFHPGLASDTLTARACDVVGEELTLTHAATSADYGMIELTAPGVTKASTLAVLCAELGIASDEVVAFGDMPNDRAMLEWAGRGYVVASAHPSLLDAGFSVIPGDPADAVGRTILALLGDSASSAATDPI